MRLVGVLFEQPGNPNRDRPGRHARSDNGTKEKYIVEHKINASYSSESITFSGGGKI